MGLEEKETYCNECGNENFPRGFEFDNYYANGRRYICKECGNILWVNYEEE